MSPSTAKSFRSGLYVIPPSTLSVSFVVDVLFDTKGIKKFAEVEPITRCRRKLQEKHPELRGELYEKRHQMKESVKEEIINWDEEQSSLFK